MTSLGREETIHCKFTLGHEILLLRMWLLSVYGIVLSGLKPIQIMIIIMVGFYYYYYYIFIIIVIIIFNVLLE